LNRILKYNVKNNLLFLRISSDLIPFALHSICKFSWYRFFQSEFEQIGYYIKNTRSVFVCILRIGTTLFKKFLKETEDLDFDMKIEIKDKDKAALKALELLRRDQMSIVVDEHN
jgi:UV DNA damage repair endonuclease